MKKSNNYKVNVVNNEIIIKVINVGIDVSYDVNCRVWSARMRRSFVAMTSSSTYEMETC